jgi:hypothetical protein
VTPVVVFVSVNLLLPSNNMWRHDQTGVGHTYGCRLWKGRFRQTRRQTDGRQTADVGRRGPDVGRGKFSTFRGKPPHFRGNMAHF